MSRQFRDPEYIKYVFLKKIKQYRPARPASCLLGLSDNNDFFQQSCVCCAAPISHDMTLASDNY